MSFEIDMAHCAAHEDERQREAAALDREQARLEAVAVTDALTGNFDRLWSAVDYADHDKRLMQVLMRAHHWGIADATALIKALAQTYATNNAEVV